MANQSQSPGPGPDKIAGQAAAWLARRDRGLTAAEQDDYIQWLVKDPRHAESVAQHAAAFERMMQLYEWQPGDSPEPNADLFAPPRRSRWPRLGLSLAAAATLAICGALSWRATETSSAPTVAQPSHLRVNESHALPDGSLVELKEGSRIAVDFSAEQRQVRLVGEAHFQVARDAARPFVVNAQGVMVRAVGTAFSVRVDSDEVQVLVTHGRVHVLTPTQGRETMPEPAAAAAARELPLVVAGQRAVVNLSAAASPQVSNVAAPQIAEALDWRAPRLQFFETPLEVAIAEFNARNRTQLVIGQPPLGSVPIGGTFRVDNVDGFVRLLKASLDIQAEPRAGNQIVLTRTR
jgi:transmembrane sensor